jgi:Domain of unknown function (DUF5664)
MSDVKDQTAKADGGKTDPTLLQKDFAAALALVQRVLDYGAEKYSRGSWQNVDLERWDAAQRRHQQKLDLNEAYDEESGLPHRAHQIAGLIIMFQIELGLAAKATSLSELETIAVLGKYNPPPQEHKTNASVRSAPTTNEDPDWMLTAPPARKCGVHATTGVAYANIGDWVLCKSEVACGHKLLITAGTAYKILELRGDYIRIELGTGTSGLYLKRYFY